MGVYIGSHASSVPALDGYRKKYEHNTNKSMYMRHQHMV